MSDLRTPGHWPPRSLLFIPGNQPELLAKVERWRPDVVVLDLEDAVSVAQKDRARDCVIDALGKPAPRGVHLAVRVNGFGTPWFDADVAAVAGSSARFVVLPKLEDPRQLRVLGDRLGERRSEVSIIGGIESVRGVADARPIVEAGGVEAVYFGAEDFVADLGGRRTGSTQEVLFARSHVVLCARLAGIAAIDQAVVAVRDAERFRADAVEGVELGYRGKVCVHPDQVAIAHEVFAPSAAEIAHAREVIEAAGAGLAVVDGQMVDAVHLRMARDVLERAGEVAP